MRHLLTHKIAGCLLALCLLLTSISTISAQDAQPPFPDDFEPHILFEASNETTWGIYAADVDTLEVVPLLERSHDVGGCPHLSPDRTKVAYRRIFTNPLDILLMNIYIVDLTTGEEIIAGTFLYDWLRDSGASCLLAWSPDSQWLKFMAVGDDGFFDTYIVQADGRNVQRVSQRPDGDFFLAWDVDSTHFYMKRLQPAITRTNITTLESETIIEVGFNDAITFSPQQTYMAINPVRPMSTEPFSILNLTTGEQTPLPQWDNVAFINEDTRLVFMENSIALQQGDIATGELTSLVMASVLPLTDPVWSSDAQQFLFAHTDRDNVRWIVYVDATNPGVVTFLSQGTHPRFTADDAWVVYYAEIAPGEYVLHRMRPDGSENAVIPGTTVQTNWSWGSLWVEAY